MSRTPYDPDRIERINDPSSFRYCSAEELRYILDPDPTWTIADFGSGTGLFTAEFSPVVKCVIAIDIRKTMHIDFRRRGVPKNVIPLVADFQCLPIAENSLDAGVSIRTYHHGLEDALPELARVIRPGGRLVIVDWSATGSGDHCGNDSDNYLDIASVQSQLIDKGFQITLAQERLNTFLVIASRRSEFNSKTFDV